MGAATTQTQGRDVSEASARGLRRMATVNRALAVLTGLRNDEANRDFWPEVDALLVKLEAA